MKVSFENYKIDFEICLHYPIFFQVFSLGIFDLKFFLSVKLWF